MEAHREAARKRVEQVNARVEQVNARAGRNLPAAILSGIGLLGWIGVSLVWFKVGFVLLVAVAMVLGTVELHRAMLAKAGMRSAIVPIAVGSVGIVVASYIPPERALLSPTILLLAVLGLTVVASLAWRLPGGPEGFVKDAAASLFTIAYVPLLGSFLSLMLGPPDGVARVVTFILCIVASDTGGYVAGVLFGKHPLAPRISPKKTWEGSAGSVALALVIGGLMAHYVLHVSVWVGLVFGFAMVVFGTFGDLIESMIKRDLGLKDMSNFVPGHGGMLDRLDSVLFAAPIAWLLLHVLVPIG